MMRRHERQPSRPTLIGIKVEMAIPEQVRLRIADGVGFNSAAAERVPECDNLEKKIRTIARQSAPRVQLEPAPAL